MSHGIVYTEQLLASVEAERERRQLGVAHVRLALRRPVERFDGVERAVIQSSGSSWLLASDLGDVQPDKCTECDRPVVGIRALRGRRQCSGRCARIYRERHA